MVCCFKTIHMLQLFVGLTVLTLYILKLNDRESFTNCFSCQKLIKPIHWQDVRKVFNIRKGKIKMIATYIEW